MAEHSRQFGDVLASNVPDRRAPLSSPSKANSLLAELDAFESPGADSAPVRAGKPGAGPSVYCSQCKAARPESEFPIRITSLERYMVCKSHTWYWTAAVKAKNWAPETVSSLDEMLRDLDELESDSEGQRTWIVAGGQADELDMLDVIAARGNWDWKWILIRPSRSKVGPVPEPVNRYRLHRGKGEPMFKITFTFHASSARYVIKVQPEATPRSVTAAWRKDRPTKRDAVAVLPDDAGAAPPKRRKTKKALAALAAQEALEAQLRLPPVPPVKPVNPLLSSQHLHSSLDPILNSPLSQLLQAAVGIPGFFTGDTTNGSIDLESLFMSPEPRISQAAPFLGSPNTTPIKRHGSTVEEISPGSQFDELDSVSGGDVELSARSDDAEDDQWLTGLVRGELGGNAEGEDDGSDDLDELAQSSPPR